jgi:AraC family transcriptional regulator, transcriptional activator of pobA
MNKTTLDDLAERSATGSSEELRALLPENIQQEIGHFNVVNLTQIRQPLQEKRTAPYQCATFYKISLLTGPSTIEYPGRPIDVKEPTLLFTTPKKTLTWQPLKKQTGYCCLFTAEFLHPTRSGIILDELPIYRSPEYPVYTLSKNDLTKVKSIFANMHAEISSNYAYKYDLLRAYAIELIHIGQKLQSSTMLHPNHNSFARTTSLFVELLERQFPLDNPQQRIGLRTAKDYADQLAVHVNHLNKVLKETTGLTTTALIAGRILQEAKILLRQTDWTISEIADSLGFSDFAHFAKFFKSETGIPPGTFRSQTQSLNYT